MRRLGGCRARTGFCPGMTKRMQYRFDICQWSYMMTYMVKTQIYLSEEDLNALRETARRSGRSMADLVREAVRQVWLHPGSVSAGPVALWCGMPSRTSIEHDAIYDEQ